MPNSYNGSDFWVWKSNSGEIKIVNHHKMSAEEVKMEEEQNGSKVENQEPNGTQNQAEENQEQQNGENSQQQNGKRKQTFGIDDKL